MPAPAASSVVPLHARQLQRLGAETVRLAAGGAPAADRLWVFTGAAQDALSRAQDAAERSRQPWIGTSHLLQGLAEASEGRAALAMRRLGADAGGLASAEPEEAAEPSSRRLPPPQLPRRMRRAPAEAERDCAPPTGPHLPP